MELIKSIESGSEISFEARAISELCKGLLTYQSGRMGAGVAGVLGLQENHAAWTGISFCDRARNAEPKSFIHKSDCDPFYL